MSMLSSTCSVISRASSPPQRSISRSASVDLPWSICAMIAKLRIWARSVIGAYCRSTAPVALLAAVVIFLATASISASVRVWSAACSRTATASDLRPSPRPVPW